MPEQSSLTNTSEGAALSLEISSLTHDGRGIGFLQNGRKERGLAVFVAGALPGETVTCQIRTRNKNFIVADFIDVITEAPELTSPICTHWQVCGGCSLQRMPYARQLDWKKKILNDALSKIGAFPPDFIREHSAPPIGSPALAAYRNKVEFSFGYDIKGKPAFGFRARGSHSVFNIENCAVIDNKALQLAKEFASQALGAGLTVYDGNKGYLRFLTLRQSSGEKNGWTLLCLCSAGTQAERRLIKKTAKKLLAANPEIRAFILEERRQKDWLASGQKRFFSLNAQGEDDPQGAIITQTLAGKCFHLDAGGFFQINSRANELLQKMIIKTCPAGASLLDLYSGVGVPGLLLADRFKSVTSLEENHRSVRFLRENAARFQITNCKSLAGDAAKLLLNLGGQKWDVCLLDPPRQGLSADAMAGLIKAAPETILYISCNPATLARDLGILKEKYNLEWIGSVDLFPHTPHIETCALLRSGKSV